MGDTKSGMRIIEQMKAISKTYEVIFSAKIQEISSLELFEFGPLQAES